MAAFFDFCIGNLLLGPLQGLQLRPQRLCFFRQHRIAADITITLGLHRLFQLGTVLLA